MVSPSKRLRPSRHPSPRPHPHPHPRVLLCALAPDEAPRPARLPAAEVTVSPKRSHSPSSMNPDRAREHRAWRTDSCGPGWGLRPGTTGLALQLWGFEAGCSLSWSLLPPGVGCGGHKLQSALPIPPQGWPACGLRLFWLPHHPLASPPPRPPPRGWSCRAGPLNPGRTGGRLLGAGGWGEATRSAVARSAPSTARGGGRRARPGAVG